MPRTAKFLAQQPAQRRNLSLDNNLHVVGLCRLGWPSPALLRVRGKLWEELEKIFQRIGISLGRRNLTPPIRP
jgi:hypothetical protein